MHLHRRHSSVLLFCGLALCAETALSQSLSIIKKGASEFLLEAAAPPDTRYALQASGNLQLWVDINDDLSGQVSNRLDITAVKHRFFRLTPWTESAPPIRLALLGDSTIWGGENDYGPGWGKGIYGYLKPTVQVVNLAWPNFSTKAFLASEQEPRMRAIKPDFVLVEFGWVDWGGCPEIPPVDPDRCRTTLEEFAENMKTIVHAIRAFNGTPILVTPVDPRLFDDNGKVLPLLKDQVAVVKSLAAELQTHLIDLNQLSHDLYNELGDSGSAYISAQNDPVHFSVEGAQIISGLVVNALPNSLGPYLIGNPTPPPKP
ncbi:MAG: GDSL-type esterase/lipase family protein [Acidobacteria bacterium]|nr:GDSL-type esterase/lipase family protein [Acidobacteriota bacterium]